jgi:hypothetical protein
LRWGTNLYYAGQAGGAPFWVNPGLKLTTILYAAALTIAGATILGVLQGLKATSAHVHAQLRNLGVGGSTLRFGRFWTAAMIAQVAITVILLPPASGISEEALRDRQIRSRFPTERYLAVRVELNREAPAPEPSAPAGLSPVEQAYAEFERRIAQEPGVVAVTFGDRLPGMGPSVRTAEFEVSDGTAPVVIPNLWMTSVGPNFFETFDIPLIAGRAFHQGDRVPDGRTVLVNEAFVRRYLNGLSPIGRRVRYASVEGAPAEPWLDIVGVVGDVGMTPTDLGEAPYIFRPASAATTSPIVMGIRVNGDPSAVAPRIRAIAANLDLGLRLDEVRSLDDIAWSVDVPALIGAGTISVVVILGLFLSAAGIFSLMSVSVARRTREIGLRSALGATRARLLGGIFSHALALVGSGIAAGNLILLLFIAASDEAEVGDVADALLTTSMVMLAVGMLACIEPARRALRIQPTDALKEA